ncbi:cache domain-containing sensor histidine kinase [Thiospirochaeta perfilievii]|uniref:cache domain-containing sensor histidine kinase n=1 Tax=Thiospirochaeta perfilievii TaxID=252967 RepID=UPI0016595761|nr:sensor histidine kinase [Thiospirochaeta perfilievii]
MKKRFKYNPTIGQNILIATISIVIVVLLLTSAVYYAVFSSRTEDLIESQSREINKQIVLNYENYINSVIETANYIQFSSLSMDVDKNFEKLQDIFNYNTSIKKDVVSIFLFSNNGEKVLGTDLNNRYFNSILGEVWFKEAKKETNITHFSAPHTNSFTLTSNENVIFLSRSVEYVQRNEKKVGILLIELNFKTLTDMAAKTNLGNGGHIIILNDKDNLIYLSNSSENIPYLDSLEIAVENFIGGLKTKINSIDYYININTLVHTRWRIVTVNNVNDIALARKEMILILFFIFFISLFLTAIISIFISKRITRPLNTLKDSMLKLEEGNFDSKVEVNGQKEVVRLSKSFNSMIEEIRTLMDKVVAEQTETRKNELRALQNQINPHFLYNTLDSIVWLAENHRSKDVITTVVALARFFRISISSGATQILVKDEISHVENYLKIQKIRYIDKFKYTMDVSNDVEDLYVMKLILQPIVENAIYHGVGDDMELISIRSYKDEKYLYFEVENSGYGITEERISEIYSMLEGADRQTSVGLKNVYQRLKLFYGDSADLKILSILDESTIIKLIIPLDKTGVNS